MTSPVSTFVVNGNVITPSGPPLGNVTEGIGFPLRPIQQGIATAVAAYAGLKINTNKAFSLPNNGTYSRITNYDAATYATPINVTSAVVAGTLAIGRASAYLAQIVVSMQFDENNASREFFLRLFNVTDSTQVGDAVAIFVGRNTGGIDVSFTLPFDGVVGLIGKAMAIELGNADVAFTNVILRNAIFAITGVGT